LVEGWVVGADGKAAADDFHGLKKSLSLNTLDKSMTYSATLEVGAGTYDGGKITGLRGNGGSVKGVYDRWQNGDPTKVTWAGVKANNLKYTVTFTLNNDGTWVWKDPSAGMNLSGKFNTLNP